MTFDEIFPGVWAWGADGDTLVISQTQAKTREDAAAAFATYLKEECITDEVIDPERIRGRGAHLRPHGGEIYDPNYEPGEPIWVLTDPGRGKKDVWIYDL